MEKALDRVDIERRIESKSSLVYFYTPNCPFCKEFSSVWKELEETFAGSSDGSLISVDCSQQESFCHEHNKAQSYPSIFWIASEECSEQFKGERTFSELREFVERKKHCRVKRSLFEKVGKTKSGVYELTDQNFHEFVSTDCSFVKFYMPGCKHCLEVNQLWDPLAQSLADHNDIKIARVNCMNFPDLCLSEARGCPTLKIISNGETLVKDYHTDLSLEGLSDCIVSNCRGGQGKAYEWNLSSQQWV